MYTQNHETALNFCLFWASFPLYTPQGGKRLPG